MMTVEEMVLSSAILAATRDFFAKRKADCAGPLPGNTAEYAFVTAIPPATKTANCTGIGQSRHSKPTLMQRSTI
jgi:hypothetical protein